MGEGGSGWMLTERRSKVFVKIQKKTFLEGGGGWGDGVGGVGGPIRGWGGGSSKVWGRWVMWGMGDVNLE